MIRLKPPTKEQIAQVEELSKTLIQVELMKAMGLGAKQFNNFRRVSSKFDEAYLRGSDSNPQFLHFLAPPTKEQIAQVEELSKTLTQKELMKAMNLTAVGFNNFRRLSSKFDEVYLRGSDSNPRVRFKPKQITPSSKLMGRRANKPKQIVYHDVLFEEEIMKLAMLVVEMPVEEAIEKTIGLSKEKYNKARKNQPHLVYTIDVANAYRLENKG